MARRSPRRLVLTLWILGSALGAIGCTASASRSGLTGAGPARFSGPLAASGATLEQRARRSNYPRVRAEAYLDAARAYLAEGRNPEGLRCAHEARQSFSGSRLVGRAHRLLGQAHLASRQFLLAERYLRRGLAGSTGTERELTIARLVVTLRALDRRAEAKSLEEQLNQNRSRDVSKLLAMNPSRPATRPAPQLSKGTPVAPKRPAAPAKTFQTKLPRLTVHPRSSWNARTVIRTKTDPLGRVHRVTIHHSAGPHDVVASTRSATVNEIRKIQRYHQKQRGWADIGYHYVVDRLGEVWQARSLLYQGAHASGAANRGNVGIVVLGNYSRNRQHLNDAQRRSLSLLTAKLCDHFKIPATRVYTHEEIRPGHTSCPGPEISRYVSSLRTTLRKRQLALAASRQGIRATSYQGNQPIKAAG